MGALGLILGWVRGIGLLVSRGYSWIKATTWGKWVFFYLLTYMGGIIGRMLTMVGVSLVINQFLTPSLTPFIAGNLLSLPTEWIQLLALTKIDQAITVVMSAMAIAMADKVQVRARRNAWQTPL
jgi:hypothetical protein